MALNNLTNFPVGNGDTTLIEVDEKTILTDVNYRMGAVDPDEDEYDFAPDWQKACLVSFKDYRLSVFVLTHPDVDHLRGFTELFYCGDPDTYKNRKSGDEKLILVEEMWISPHAEAPNYETDDSKLMFKEIDRRLALRGTTSGEKDGNRIKTLDTDGDHKTGSLTANISWEVLAPTLDEANIEDEEDSPEHASSNDSSLVIRWMLKVDGGVTRVLIAGDATVEVWDRIWNDYKRNTDRLKRHILLAPHHCSRGVMARKQEDDSYEFSDDALRALDQFDGDGFVVSSSKKVKRNDDNPPSWEAKQKYLGMLKKAKEKEHENRFLNPDTHKDDKPEPVVFDLTKSGPVLKTAGTASFAKNSLGSGAVISPTYG
ncbi:MAG: hypothetical protein NPIRA04_03930 [Nitrospirales bacterium]|nr:MAG: hypothetical protein NPIRA04_03930 [Nitrospirales bacterium]